MIQSSAGSSVDLMVEFRSRTFYCRQDHKGVIISLTNINLNETTVKSESPALPTPKTNKSIQSVDIMIFLAFFSYTLIQVFWIS